MCSEELIHGLSWSLHATNNNILAGSLNIYKDPTQSMIAY